MRSDYKTLISYNNIIEKYTLPKEFYSQSEYDKNSDTNSDILKINHSAGFFSCCTIKLEEILKYFNTYKKLPSKIDGTSLFDMYKQVNNESDITNIFFTQKDYNINYNSDIKTTSSDSEQQFSNYKLLNHTQLNPFIKKYFTISQKIQNNVEYLEKKYNLNYNNLCSIYYRGLGKSVETNSGTYDEYLKKAKEIENKHPNIIFLLQSDESEFYSYMKKHLKNTIELDSSSVSNNTDTPDYFSTLSKNERLPHAIKFLSVIYILSKSKYIITSSGNTGLWICLFRGNSNGVIQYLSEKEIIYGVKNKNYKLNKDYWLI